MAFDVYNLIQAKEVREYLRKHRKFSVLEQEVIIRYSYYTIEQKLKFMKQLLYQTKEESVDKEELELLEERVRMYEFIVNFIRNPGEDVIYMSHEDVDGYNIDSCDNDYRLSESVMPDTHYFKTFDDLMTYWDMDGVDLQADYRVGVDMIVTSEFGVNYSEREIAQPVWFYLMHMDGAMQIVNFDIADKWFIRWGFSKECVDDFLTEHFRSPLPFENGCRVKLQTPSMKEPVFGIMDSSQDCFGCWYHFLLFENEKYSARDLRNLLEGEFSQYADKILQREIDQIDLSYPRLDMCDAYLTYDWITRAEDQKR